MTRRASQPVRAILLAAVPSLALAGAIGGCELLVEFDRDLLETTGTCASSAECEDGNPCTTDVCLVEGACQHLPVPDGPVDAQEPADCLRTDCAAGQIVESFDPTDTADDFNACTEDVCDPETLAPSSVPLPYETPCQEGGGAGECACLYDGQIAPCSSDDVPTCLIGCTPETAAEVCNDDNPCTVDSCDSAASVCVREPLDGVPAPEQALGDCQILLCESGVPTSDTDNSDVPDDDNDCTEDQCVDGRPDHANAPKDTPCGEGSVGVCDEAGLCVGCTSSEQCDPEGESCGCRQCLDQECVSLDSGVVAPACQTHGDCKVLQCNGAGGYSNVVDDSDSPSSDGNVCTDEVCTSGTPSHANNTDPCDDGLYCNGTDTCAGGSCSIHTGDPCPGPDGDGDCSETCAESTDSCSGNDPGGSSCDDGLYCNGTDTCNASGSCASHSGNPCPGADGDSDCSEGCNETNDSCTANDPNGSVCSDGLYCNGIDTCSAGSCSSHAGDPCGAASDSNCAACSETNDNCSAAEPSGSPCDDGLYCNGTDTCNSSGSCANHTGDPCAPFVGDCDPDCSESCNESSNDCTANDPAGTQCDQTSNCSYGYDGNCSGDGLCWAT